MTRAIPVSLTIVAATSWAAATVLTKVALRELMPLELLGVELSTSAIAMGCLLAVRGGPFLPRSWPVFAAIGVLEPGLSFFGVLLARLLLGERVSRLTRAAIAAGFAGTALVGLAETGHGASLVGDLLVLAASVAAAGSGVGVRRMSAEADNLAATTTQLFAAALFAVPVVVIAGGGATTGFAGADPAHVIAAIATGLLGGAVPFLAFNLAIRRLTVAHAGLILNLIPVLAAGGAVIALGERLHWPEIVGGALVVGAATAAVILDGRSPAGARSSAAIRDDDIARCCVSVAG